MNTFQTKVLFTDLLVAGRAVYGIDRLRERDEVAVIGPEAGKAPVQL
jgi:hypothetical protein